MILHNSPLLAAAPRAARLGKFEFLLVVFATGYALCLLIGRPFATRPGYAYMQGLGPEWVWSLAFFLAVGVELVGVAARSGRLRQLGLVVIGLVLALISLCLADASPHSPGWWTYLMLAVSAFLAASDVRS